MIVRTKDGPPKSLITLTGKNTKTPILMRGDLIRGIKENQEGWTAVNTLEEGCSATLNVLEKADDIDAPRCRATFHLAAGSLLLRLDPDLVHAVDFNISTRLASLIYNSCGKKESVYITETVEDAERIIHAGWNEKPTRPFP